MLATVVAATSEMWILPVLGLCWLALGLLLGKLLYNNPKAPHTPQYFRPKPAPVPSHVVPADEPGAENRVYPRYETNQIRLIVAPPEPAPQLEGLLINQSMGGLCICLSQPLPESSYLHVRSAEPSQQSDWILVQIRHCRPQRGGWAIGCQFANGKSTQLLFG